MPALLELMRWGIQYNPNSDTSGPVMSQLMKDPEGLRKRILARFGHPGR